jgi:hypothetical protein
LCKGTLFKKPLYSPTPSNDATEVTSLARPRNSGVKPILFVLETNFFRYHKQSELLSRDETKI